MHAKIGVFAVGLAAYWPQFDGMKQQLLQHHQLLIEKFKAERVVDAGMVDTAECAKAAGQVFREQNVRLLFCHLATYASSETLLPIIQELKDIPVILLNLQAQPALDMAAVQTIQDWLGAGCTCAGLPEMTAVLKRYNHPFSVITGHLANDRIADQQIQQWCQAAHAVGKLQSGNIGLIGRPYPGMMDLYLDETNLYRELGCLVKHLNWEDLALNLNCGFDTKAIDQAKQRIQQTFELPKDITAKQLAELATVLLAVEKLVQDHHLIALANHFEVAPVEVMQRILSASNPVFSILNQTGVACPVESDMKVAIALSLLKQIGGSATLAELYSMDFNQDLCIMGHSGAGDPAIASHKSLLKMSAVFHGKPGSGFLTQFTPDLGPVTLLSLTQDHRGHYRFVLAEGEIVSGKCLQLGDTNCTVRFKSGMREFINNWSQYGPTHHAAMGLGHHQQTLLKVSTLLKVPVDIV